MIEKCWNEIGIQGDRSCAELNTVIHCRNCSVYTRAGRNLLERDAPENYRAEWTNLLAQTPTPVTSDRNTLPQLQRATAEFFDPLSLVIFRLGAEWLALAASTFQEITPPSPIHTLPHRSNEILLGLVNIRGELLPCISLSNLLGLERQGTHPKLLNQQGDLTRVVYSRMVVVNIQGDIWVFSVDEIEGIHRCDRHLIEEVPSVVSKAPISYTKWIVNWRNKKINYLDEELVFSTLKRRIL
ncbi:purine-binding chemotaxis protein CheW [Phormidium pseudopriestleyi FRX01]|uniref:Chemotaxis protein CheW n=1 Tax=Phormidium pseudopriestleyi FRX01 TaxID=1759528 RepID=A0ABS3FNA1_9CYAN|nr:chemotaxis protein CheW [Phormidium pseudopriestleyi]MBO0348523.1 purine-binding chemotaxis protein CheW [Phormidium pseudopriestleyi FRX01]